MKRTSFRHSALCTCGNTANLKTYLYAKYLYPLTNAQQHLKIYLSNHYVRKKMLDLDANLEQTRR